MAVPRLRDEKCFLRLDPEEIEDTDHATTIGGSSGVGEQVGPEDVDPIDLIVSGSVAVNNERARVGKGEGYSDLEFAILREFGPVDDETTTVTTVHEIRVVDDQITTTSHDVPIDLIATPEQTLGTNGTSSKPMGIKWDDLEEFFPSRSQPKRLLTGWRYSLPSPVGDRPDGAGVSHGPRMTPVDGTDAAPSGGSSEPCVRRSSDGVL